MLRPGFLAVWPQSGAPAAYFEVDGGGFKLANVADDDDDEDAAEDALDAVMEWACAGGAGPMPAGWLVARAGEALQ